MGASRIAVRLSRCLKVLETPLKLCLGFQALIVQDNRFVDHQLFHLPACQLFVLRADQPHGDAECMGLVFHAT